MEWAHWRLKRENIWRYFHGTSHGMGVSWGWEALLLNLWYFYNVSAIWFLYQTRVFSRFNRPIKGQSNCSTCRVQYSVSYWCWFGGSDGILKTKTFWTKQVIFYFITLLAWVCFICVEPVGHDISIFFLIIVTFCWICWAYQGGLRATPQKKKK